MNFKISGDSKIGKNVISGLNVAFDKLDSLIENYENKETEQGFKVINTELEIKDASSTFYVEDLPLYDTNVFGFTGVTRQKIGVLSAKTGLFSPIESSYGNTYTIYQIYRSK